MITSILMKGCATYPSDGALIGDCQKVNFFYGPNGSGKSTIGNFLNSQDAPQYSSCEIKWQNNSALNVIVYNREFRERHFREDIDGIFTLGEATIEDMDKLNKLKQERDKKAQELATRKQTLYQKENEWRSTRERYCDSMWSRILKQNESDFRDVFRGLRGNKAKFADEVVKRYEVSRSSSEKIDR